MGTLPSMTTNAETRRSVALQLEDLNALKAAEATKKARRLNIVAPMGTTMFWNMKSNARPSSTPVASPAASMRRNPPMATGLYCQFRALWRIRAKWTWMRFIAPRKIAAEATIMYQSDRESPMELKGR